MNAGQVVSDARDMDPAFDKTSTPIAVALRQLAKFQQGWLATIAHYKRDAVHDAQTIALTVAELFTTGVAISAHLAIHGGSITWKNTDRRPADLELVEYPLRNTMLEMWRPRGYVRARSLFLLDTPDLWSDVASVTLDLFPAGPDTLAADDELMLPGQHGRACTEALAGFMAGRAKVQVASTGAIESYLDEVTDRRRAKVSQIREVY